MYSITNLKQDLTGILHGTTLNQITDIDGLIYRAARQVLLDVDAQELKRQTPLASAIYDKVYDYPIPDDVKGVSIVDIRPQVSRRPGDSFIQSYSKPFDLSKDSLLDQFNVNFNTGVKTIRIADSGLVPGVTLNEADSLTSNGTWAAGGTASNLSVDNINFVAGGASLKFDLATGTGWLENSTMTSQDLSEWIDQANQFLYTYLQTASGITSVTLRWGTDSSNYYTQTVTLNQQDNAFVNGWNLLDFDWNGATSVGSPDASDISYLRVSWISTSNQTGMRLDNIVSRLGTILEIVYYSKYMFRDATTGAWQETVTDDSNLVNLDTESYNLLLYQLAYLAAQQQQGVNATQFDAPYFAGLYSNALKKYQTMYKSEIQQPQQSYYTVRKGGYSKYTNVRFNG